MYNSRRAESRESQLHFRRLHVNAFSPTTTLLLAAQIANAISTNRLVVVVESKKNIHNRKEKASNCDGELQIHFVMRYDTLHRSTNKKVPSCRREATRR